MTTANLAVAVSDARPAAAAADTFRLPDPPERGADEKMTNYIHIFDRGQPENLRQHLGRRETTLIGAELYITLAPGDHTIPRRRPDLLIALNVNLEMYRQDNGYIVSRQGKPPDFVLEVASESTGAMDTGVKRDNYEGLGVAEYWRFDETGGDWHGAPLAGDRLADGVYRPIPIERGETADGVVYQGYSRVLNLILRWEGATLRWIDPLTGRHIATYDDLREELDREREARVQEREALVQEREARIREREARIQEREARIREREARDRAEARVRELEAELERLRGG